MSIKPSISKFIPQQFYDDRAAYVAQKFQEVGALNPKATIREFIDEIVKPFSDNPKEIDAFTLGYICRILEHQNTIEKVNILAETLQGLLNGCMEHLVKLPESQAILKSAALEVLGDALREEGRR